MNAIKHIRKNVFKATQQEFAEIAGVQQSTVHRWERGVPPTLTEMNAIREAARARKLKWNDALFFNEPPSVERAAS